MTTLLIATFVVPFAISLIIVWALGWFRAEPSLPVGQYVCLDAGEQVKRARKAGKHAIKVACDEILIW